MKELAVRVVAGELTLVEVDAPEKVKIDGAAQSKELRQAPSSSRQLRRRRVTPEIEP